MSKVNINSNKPLLKDTLVNRELSWLSFNERVLLEAANIEVPLYERLKFLAIYSSNLDEFFRVRVALIKRLILIDKDKLNKKTSIVYPTDLLKEIHSIVNSQQELFGEVLNHGVLPALRKQHIYLYYNENYKEAHLEQVKTLFFNQISGYLQPKVYAKDNDGSIFLKNRKLYMICDLEKEGKSFVGIVNIPNNKVNRFYSLDKVDVTMYYTFIDDIVSYHKEYIFSGYTVLSKSNIKLNRDSELFLDQDYSRNIVEKINKSLTNRNTGKPSRLLYEQTLTKDTLLFLKNKLVLSEHDLVSGGTYHSLEDFFSLPNPKGSELENEKLLPLSNRKIQQSDSIFDAIKANDILLAFPYHKYDYIIRLFNEAALDRYVLEIKVTLYRVAKESVITNALISAAKNGKKVTVLVEAKARFDEVNNIKWANKLSKAGVNVKFSSEKLKVHSKVALIKRKGKAGNTDSFAFFGTGNFNEKTASIYTDFALLTSKPSLTKELDQTLDYAFGLRKEVELKELLVAKINIVDRFKALINNEIIAVKNGEKGEVILKLNNLEDVKMIKLLYKAAKLGVKVILIIRGICCMKPLYNIKIIRIIDQFLEHSRVYIFHNNGEPLMFVGSADLMKRNLKKRIEVVFPIYDKEIKEQINKSIQLQLSDNVKAVTLDEDMNNIPVASKGKRVRSQNDFYTYLKNIEELL